MQVLFLTCHLPFPPHSGGRRREYELIRRLGREFQVELVAVSKTPIEDRAHALSMPGVSGVRVFAAEPSANGGSTLMAPQVARHRCAAASDYLARRLAAGGCDAVHVEGFYLMQHVPDRPGAPVLLGEQNVEHRLWRLRALAERDPVAREVALGQARTTAAAEHAAWRRADMCVTVTEEDRRALLEEAPEVDARVVVDGTDHDSGLGDGSPDGLQMLRAGRGPLLVMVGNYAYAPNLDAAAHLLDEVLPLVWTRRPDARVLLVGNAPGADLLARSRRDPRVAVTGRVAAVEPFLAAADVVVCPLRYGGGVKVKMLEALRHGCAIAATPVALQGLPGADRAVRVADDPRGLARAITGLLDDAGAARDLRDRARTFALGLPGWDAAAGALTSCYRELAASARRGDRRAA